MKKRKFAALILAVIMATGFPCLYSGAENEGEIFADSETKLEEASAEGSLTISGSGIGELITDEPAEEDISGEEYSDNALLPEVGQTDSDTAAEQIDTGLTDIDNKDETLVYNGIELEEIIITDDNMAISDAVLGEIKMADLAGESSSASEYSQKALLSELQQEIYDIVFNSLDINLIDDESESITLDFTVSGEITGTNDLASVIWAVYRDNPSLYWFNTALIRLGSEYTEETDTTEILYILFTLGTASEVREYISEVSGIEEQVISACAALDSEYEKALYIHDYVCDAADYDNETSNYYISTGSILRGSPFTPVGVFIEGSAVCQGYSLAVKLLCNDVGINCLYQSGKSGTTSHAWNWVEMDDGLWYGLDATWDGQTSSTYCNYFLLGTDNFNTKRTYTNSYGITISADDYVYAGDSETSERDNKMALLISNMTADDDPADGSSWNKESPSSFKWSYINGCMASALMDLSEGTEDESYIDFADRYMSAFISDSYVSSGSGYILGSFSISSYALDDLNSGKALINLISQGSENSTKYEKAVSETLYTNILKYMLSNKTTAEGNLWHKNVYPYQVWLDGIYMETPFFLQYELEIGEDAGDFKEAAENTALQITNVYNKLRDPETGLYYHGYDAQADPESGSYDASSAVSWALNTTGNNTGASSEFWLRGTGWYAMALVDDIALLKEGEEKFGLDLSSEINTLSAYYKELMDALLEYRDSDSGLWYQVIDKAGRTYNYTETSGSAAAAYALMKGANLGIVESSYYEEGYDVFLSLCDEKLLYTDSSETDVVLNDICGTAGLAGPSSGKTSSSATRGYGYKTRDGSYEYYVSEATVTDDAKGAAPLIMAYNQILLKESGKTTDFSPAEASTETATETTTETTTVFVSPPSFNVAGVFGGRNVTFSSDTEGAVIYYSSASSTLTEEDASVENGETVLFEDFYGTIYARAYYEGSWSNVSRLILKIPVVNTPTVTVNGTEVTIKSTTPSSFICYTEDGSVPVIEADGTVTNGTWLKVNGSRTNSGTITAAPGSTVRAAAVRSCFTTSSSAAAYVAVQPAAFAVAGAFGGRNVTFTSTTEGAKIYYSSTSSTLTTSDACVENGETLLFTDFYGTIYARAYYNGKWSNVSRLILKIPTINDPTITYSGGKAVIRTTTPSCYIYYTTDGSTPSITNGTKLCSNSYGQITVSSGITIKAIAVRSCFTNSNVITYTP